MYLQVLFNIQLCLVKFISVPKLHTDLYLGTFWASPRDRLYDGVLRLVASKIRKYGQARLFDHGNCCTCQRCSDGTIEAFVSYFSPKSCVTALS
jgi:hypothetical protein